MHQGTTKCQFLLHSSRQRTCLAVAETLYLLINGLDAVVSFFDGGAEKGGEEL